MTAWMDEMSIPASWAGCRLKVAQKALGEDRRGFTLLEVLVAVTILALVAVAVFGSLDFGVRAWEKGEREAERSQEMRIVLDVIPQQIRSIHPYFFEEGPLRTPAFRGDRNSIRFISALRITGSDAKGLTFVSYFLSPRDGLMLCERSIYKKELFEDKWEARDESLLFSPLVSGISFEYQREDGEWQEDWHSGDMLGFPRAIKVTLRHREAPSGEETATTLTVPVLATPHDEPAVPGQA